MEKRLIIDKLLNADIYKYVFSSPFKDAEYKKINIDFYNGNYKVELFKSNKVYHQNKDPLEIIEYIESIFSLYKEINAWSEVLKYSVKISKRGKIFCKSTKIKNRPRKISHHNRKKEYLIEEGDVVAPLVDMKVMNKDGTINKTYYNKYKQINRYIEMIDDLVKDEKKLTILDYACGKSYLSFIVYYYLKEKLNIDIKMVGIDLKKDVIDYCNMLRDKYDYKGLDFIYGDILDIEIDYNVDMVISLHACDIATDFVLYNAMKNNVKYIFSSPCCQHEIASQIEFEDNDLIKSHGVFKQRYSEILTDAIRSELLTYMGYKTQVLEFVDITHTPKNLLIRAEKKDIRKIDKMRALKRVNHICLKYNLTPTLLRLIDKLN